MKRLILTKGLPRSGKSTWALQQGHPIVSRDAIRLTLHGKPFDKAYENTVTMTETLMVTSLFHAGHNTVIVDATHLRPDYIMRWHNYAEEESCFILIQDFPTPKEVCIERAIADGREYLIPVIERMSKYEPVSN